VEHFKNCFKTGSNAVKHFNTSAQWKVQRCQSIPGNGECVMIFCTLLHTGLCKHWNKYSWFGKSCFPGFLEHQSRTSLFRTASLKTELMKSCKNLLGKKSLFISSTENH